MKPTTQPFRHLICGLSLATLAACGGGGDDPADAGGNGGGAGGGGAGGGGNVALSCNTALFQAGSVAVPSAGQMSTYSGTYNGSEGNFGPNPGDPFVASAPATLILAADGSFTYKGVAYTASSVCIDNVAGGLGRILYVHAGTGHFDISDQNNGGDLGQAWGVSPADGAMFRLGLRP